jgi:hypothetical protein
VNGSQQFGIRVQYSYSFSPSLALNVSFQGTWRRLISLVDIMLSIGRCYGLRFKETRMYNTILVPLDGSELSECSLEHVKQLAAGCRAAEIVLLTVVEAVKTPTWWPDDRGETSAMSAELDKREAQIHDKAAGYLARVAG